MTLTTIIQTSILGKRNWANSRGEPKTIFFRQYPIPRFGCSSNQVCCDKKYIKTQNTHEPDPNEDKTHNGHYNDRSCGVGMPPRDTENTAFDTRIVVNSQGAFRIFEYY